MEFNFEGESSCGCCGVPRGGFGSFAIIVSSVSFLKGNSISWYRRCFKCEQKVKMLVV